MTAWSGKNAGLGRSGSGRKTADPSDGCKEAIGAGVARGIGRREVNGRVAGLDVDAEPAAAVVVAAAAAWRQGCYMRCCGTSGCDIEFAHRGTDCDRESRCSTT